MRLRTIAIVCLPLLALFLQIFYYSPISPDLLELPPATRISDFPWNNQLQRVTKLGEGILKQPEDVWIDEDGILFTATRDGWIKKMHTNGTWEDWKMVGGVTLLGLVTSSVNPGCVLVCDVVRGLLKVGEEGITVLASHVNGSKISLADDLIEASDGTIYFSDATTKFRSFYLDMLEAKPHGRLLVYNPSTTETSILLDDLAFPNGVALSKKQDFVVVCETWKFRCLRYHLREMTKEKVKSLSKIFLEDLIILS